MQSYPHSAGQQSMPGLSAGPGLQPRSHEPYNPTVSAAQPIVTAASLLASHQPAAGTRPHSVTGQQPGQDPSLSNPPDPSRPGPATPWLQGHQQYQRQDTPQAGHGFGSAAAAQPEQRWPASPSPTPGQSESDPGGFQGPGGPAGEDVGVAAGGRRHVGIKSKSWAGSVVWAKLARYPWWPAQVLDEDDPFIPPGSEPPRRGAVPVRFFGTYEFSWIESQRALAAFENQEDDRRSKDSSTEFRLAVEEADECMADGKLPRGFSPSYEPNDHIFPPQASLPSRPSSKGSRSRSKARPRKSDAPQGQRSAQRKVKAASAIGPQRRKDRILRALALKPPVGSPYADQMCLAGAELLVVQVKPATPPPQPAPPPVSIPALPPMIPQSWSLAQLSKMSQSMAPEALTQQFAGIAGLRFQPGVFPQLLQQPIAPQPHAPGGHSLMHQ